MAINVVTGFLQVYFYCLQERVFLQIKSIRKMKNAVNKWGILLFLLCYSFNVDAQHLIPTPKELNLKNEKKVRIVSVDEKIDMKLELPPEGYILDVKGNKVVIRAKDQKGLIWARATLKQLKDEEGFVPTVLIKDYPAFPIRAFMHDTGRNFRPVWMLKKELDLLSFYKMNAFHWHLTDYPAWRIECKAYPQLNDPQYQRKRRDEGQFYTYDEIREVIAYAKERGIMIIPEIDMPGHSQYFIDTFGFGMASPEGMKVLEKCLNEFFSEISAEDCPYMHIGSDEVHVDNPNEFMDFCENMVRQNGRIPIAWSPGLPTSPETVQQIWYASIGREIEKNGYQTPYLDSYVGYMNNLHPVLNTMKYFLHQPCGSEKANQYALGGILCLWNDVRVADKSLTFPHNGMPNGMIAFAESFWSGGKRLSLSDEVLVPDPGTTFYNALLEFEQKLMYHRDHFLYDWDMRWVANASIPWLVTLPQARGTDMDEMDWKPVRGGVIDMFALCRKYNVALQPTMDAWMTTEIHVEKDTVISAWVGFETPNRSDRMSDGIGYQGYWESQGRLFVNDQEIYPPKPWKEPGKYRYYDHTFARAPEEYPYTNEQFCWMREPAQVPLKAGWNKIKLYCPRVFPNVNSWIVTFIPISVDSHGHVSEATGLYFNE